MRRTTTKIKRNPTRVGVIPKKQKQKPFTKASFYDPGVPSQMRVVVPMYDTWIVTSTATTATQTVKVNTLADAGVTYQGLGSWSDKYLRYRVVAYDIQIEAASYHATLNQFLCTFVTNSSAVLTAATSYGAARQKGCHFHLLSTANGGSDLVRYAHKGTVEMMEGTVEVQDSTDYSALFSQDPAQLLYLQFFSATPGGASITYALNVIVKGLLYVECFDRKNVTV